jgi:hypothetical protein
MNVLNYQECKVYINNYVKVRTECINLMSKENEKDNTNIETIIYEYGVEERINNWIKKNNFKYKPKECGNCKHQIKNKNYMDQCGLYKDIIILYVYNDCSCDKHRYKE